MSEKFAEQLADFQLSHKNIVNDWNDNYVKEYGDAYHEAYDNFKQVMRIKKQWDKFKIDLALSVLSICSCGLLTAAFAGATIKSAAAKAVTNFVSRYNLFMLLNPPMPLLNCCFVEFENISADLSQISPIINSAVLFIVLNRAILCVLSKL